jgi:hypothetical protein
MAQEWLNKFFTNFAIASARPRKEVVRAEQMKQAGATGMLTGAAFNEDQEQQR